MAYPYSNNTLTNSYYPQQPMFPQPQGNVYIIQDSVEVANIPAGAGITAAICLQENLLYMKSMQNGMPMFLAYKLVPHSEQQKTTTEDTPPTVSLENRVIELEKQVQNLLNSTKENKKETKNSVSTNWDA